MPDRTTKVTLTAVISGYIAGMDAAQRKTAEFANGSAQKMAAQRQAMTMVGTAALAIGAAAAAGVALSIKAFADFDAKMSQVQTLSHATAEDMDKLRDAALHMGQAIGFSATEVADAETELVKAGVSVKDIMGGALKGALELAAAGQIDVGKATEIATIALTQFGLKGKDVPHVADLLAAGADKALGGVGDLGEALKSGGLVAAQFGVSLDETVGTLAAFANAGLIGETAGTSMRQMLLKLANPSKEAAAALDDLGIKTYDTSGQFVGMAGLAGQLATKLVTKSQADRNAAMSVIFGSRAIQAANVLYNEGAAGIIGWTTGVNDSGFAAKQAAGKMDNLKGDLSKLDAAFTTGIIESGSSANEMLRGMVQGLTGIATVVGGLPQPVLAAGVIVGGLVAVIGLVGGGALLAVPKVAAFKVALHDLNTSMSKVGLIGGGVAVAITAIVTVLGLVASANAEAIAQTKSFADSLDQTTAATTDYTRELVANSLAAKQNFVSWLPFLGQNKSAFDSAKVLGASLESVTKAATGNAAAYAALKKAYPTAATAGFDAAVKRSGLSTTAYGNEVANLMNNVDYLRGSLTDAQKITLQKAEADDKAAAEADKSKSATDAQARALEAMSGKATGATRDIGKLADTIKGFGSAQLDVNSAQRAFQAAVDSVSEGVERQKEAYKTAHKSLDGFTTSLDVGTDAGRENQAALDDIAKSSLGAAGAIFTQTGNQADATKAVQDGRDELIKALAQFGITGQAAQDYADKLGLIPKDVATALKIDTDPAQAALDAWLKANASHKIHMVADVVDGSGRPAGGSGITRATGGILPGAPSSRDNMTVNAASGEFITRASQTAIPANRRALEFMNAGGVIPGYASGGMVGFTPAPVYTPAPPRQYMPGPGAGSVTRQGDVFNIYEAEHPVAVAQAVQRRQNSLAAV